MKLTKSHKITVVFEGDEEVRAFYDLICLGKHTYDKGSPDYRHNFAVKLIDLYWKAKERQK